MVIAGCVLAGLAALIHVYIFSLESLAWEGERARATFGTSPQEAEVTKALAFNWGVLPLLGVVALIIGLAL